MRPLYDRVEDAVCGVAAPQRRDAPRREGGANCRPRRPITSTIGAAFKKSGRAPTTLMTLIVNLFDAYSRMTRARLARRSSPPTAFRVSTTSRVCSHTLR
jgi:hypothetical protein